MDAIALFLKGFFLCMILSSCGLLTPLVIEEGEELAEEAAVEVVEYEIEKHEQKKVEKPLS